MVAKWLPTPSATGFRKTPQTLVITGGPEGNRTPDLLNASQALSHLSYGPGSGGSVRRNSF